MEKYIKNNLPNMLKDLKELVSYNSVYAKDAEPFGQANRKVLDAALKMMEDSGFKTENLDYYCGYGEIGQGDEVIGILAHLDVVPAGDGWNNDPFDMIEKDGYVYGRGVTDDKGGVIGALYALKYLKESNYPLKKRIRLIVGCNEESGSRCIAHYVEKEGHIDMGFTPDGEFPGIFAEKGMIGAEITNVSSKIIAIKGGEASNIVCKKVYCELPIDSYDEAKLDQYFTEHHITYQVLKTDRLIQLTVYGQAAHASMPDLGINAIAHLMEALYYADCQDEFVSYFHDKFALTNHGELLGLEAMADAYGDTSINLGMINKEGNTIRMSFDMRFPVTRKVKDILPYLESLNLGNNHFNVLSSIEPLFFETDSPMIQALLKAYQEVTGDTESQMLAIGGGTYAKAIHNCIAFGLEFAGQNNHIHDANESLKIADLEKQVAIYIKALQNLNEL